MRQEEKVYFFIMMLFPQSKKSTNVTDTFDIFLIVDKYLRRLRSELLNPKFGSQKSAFL